MHVLLAFACNEPDKGPRRLPEGFLLTADGREAGSSTAGNLAATAIKDVHQLDMVFYPSTLLLEDRFGYLASGIESREIDLVLGLYPEGTLDQFSVGTMKGSDIKTFVASRVLEAYTAELQPAGLTYDIRFVGGVETLRQITLENGEKIDDDKYYRIAISSFYYFSGATFPSYKYRNNMDSRMRLEDRMISARDSIAEYLQTREFLPDFNLRRASVKKFELGDAGELPIFAIQGESHISPYFGHRVRTKGVVTAAGAVDWYPGGMDLFVQSLEDDNNDRTSNAIHVFLEYVHPDVKIGDEVIVEGLVYEQYMGNGISKTSLRETTALKILRSNVAFPEPVLIGKGGREIPQKVISTFNGNINLRQRLELDEGLDFWESLEGMRLSVENLRVVGFRGGAEEFERRKPKSYLNLYVVPEESSELAQKTPAGGVIINAEENDFNPEIMMLSTHALTKGLDETRIFNIGDRIEGRITGVLSYEKNIFGAGDFALVMPEAQEPFKAFANSKITPISSRPITKLEPAEHKLTIATYNVENLGGNQRTRIAEVGSMIRINLKCPDIINLVEIQDYNGADFSGDTAADRTLRALSDAIECPNADYQIVNIDPIVDADGGQPGGNIRVAMLYNAKKINFTMRPLPNLRAEVLVDANGDLSYNPGRIMPNDKVFRNTRKSIIAQFELKGERAGEKLFVIGNHWRSKLGDSSLMGATQPPVLGSNYPRAEMSERINFYIAQLLKRSPGAHVVVLGDFNAYAAEQPLQILEMQHLKNLMTYKDLVPDNERYTTNYNGNSGAIDFILASHSMLEMSPELEVLHINSDFMGRLSDHDPLIARFDLRKVK